MNQALSGIHCIVNAGTLAELRSSAPQDLGLAHALWTWDPRPLPVPDDGILPSIGQGEPPFLAGDEKPFFEAAAFWCIGTDQNNKILRLRAAALAPLRYHWLWDEVPLPKADTPKALARTDWKRFGLKEQEIKGLELRLLGNGDDVLVLSEWLQGGSCK